MQKRGESRQNQPGELTRLDQGYLQSKVEGVRSASISQVPPVCQAASGSQGFNREQNTHRLCPQEFHADGKQADRAMVFTIRIRRTSEAMAPCNLQLGYACGSRGGGQGGDSQRRPLGPAVQSADARWPKWCSNPASPTPTPYPALFKRQVRYCCRAGTNVNTDQS